MPETKVVFEVGVGVGVGLLDGFAGEGLVAGLVVGLFDGFVLGELLLCVGAGASGIGCELVATELNFGG